MPAARRLPRQPAHQVCIVPGDTNAFYYLGSAGRVLGIIQTWPADSAGVTRASRSRAAAARIGVTTYRGSDGHGNWTEDWESDTICVSPHEQRGKTTSYQLGYYTPEFFGTCPRG